MGCWAGVTRYRTVRRLQKVLEETDNMFVGRRTRVVRLAQAHRRPTQDSLGALLHMNPAARRGSLTRAIVVRALCGAFERACASRRVCACVASVCGDPPPEGKWGGAPGGERLKPRIPISIYTGNPLVPLSLNSSGGAAWISSSPHAGACVSRPRAIPWCFYVAGLASRLGAVRMKRVAMRVRLFIEFSSVHGNLCVMLCLSL